MKNKIKVLQQDIKKLRKLELDIKEKRVDGYGFIE